MDDAPQTEHGSHLAGLIAPVGRRVLGRHARLMRATGLRLGEAVAARHEPPEAAKAARRLAPVRLMTRAPAPAAPAAAAAPEASSTESTVMPGLSDWAAEYLFGDADAAASTGQAWMGGAGLEPRTPEERRLSRIKRGGPEVARAAKILEGDEPPPPAGPKRLARRPTAETGPEPASAPPEVPSYPGAARPAGTTPAGGVPTATGGESAARAVARTSRETTAAAVPRTDPAAGGETPPAPGPTGAVPPAGDDAIAAGAAGGATPGVAREARETGGATPGVAGETGGETHVSGAETHTAATRPTVARVARETGGETPAAAGESPAAPSSRATSDAMSPGGGETARPTVARVAREGGGETPAAAGESPAAPSSRATSDAMSPGGGEAARPTVTRAARETGGQVTIPEGEPARPTVSRAARETRGGEARETGGETTAEGGEPARQTVARAAREIRRGEARETGGETTAEGGEPARPTVSRLARETRGGEAHESDGPATIPEGEAARPTVARVARDSAGEMPASEVAPEAPSVASGETAGGRETARLGGGPARPAVARVARSTPSVPGEDAAAEPPQARMSRAAAHARPTVQRVSRPEPELVPVTAPAPAAPAPGLFRRIADRLRPSAAAAVPDVTPDAASPPRATISRLAQMDLQPTPPAPPISETPAIRGTNPERLARMLGTEVAHDELGNPTVAMPDYVPFSTAPRTAVSRDETTTDAPSPASTTPSPPVAGGAETSAEVDMDAIADTVIDKLRRELLIEREQAGGPMDLI